MSQQRLVPHQELGQFDGPDGERFVFIVSRTGRSVAVRPIGTGSTAGRIWHPLGADRRIEVEDRWRGRGAGWIAAFRTVALEAWNRTLPHLTDEAGGEQVDLPPSSSLGTFEGPQSKNRFAMIVSRTGRTVAARLGSERGPIVARADRPASAEPRIVYQGLHRANPVDWKEEFSGLFTQALRRAVTGVQETTAAAGGAST